MQQHRLLHDGLYAATAALDPEGATEVMAMGEALAHRSMMLAQIGHYHAAIDDAQRAMAMATDFFASRSCSFMSMISWFSIFSGSSALLISALMLDLRTVRILSRIPMDSSCYFLTRNLERER